MLLPNLFVPGAGKSGTSSLHDYLAQHPGVFMSKAKEPHFFSTDANFREDHDIKLRDYAQLFADAGGFQVRGESSTGYMVFPHVVERIHAIIDNPQFIFLLRNPIDRAYSHYWWLRGRGFENRPFREALLADMQEIPDPMNQVKGFGGYRYYFQFGRYATYITPFFETFGEEKIHIITTEQLRANKNEAINSCFRFLNLHQLDTVVSTTVNETVVYGNKSIYRFFNSFGSNSVFSRCLRVILPGGLFQKIRYSRKKMARKANSFLKTESSYPEITKIEREWLRGLYQDEVSRLRSITQMKFYEWNGDFSE